MVSDWHHLDSVLQTQNARFNLTARARGGHNGVMAHRVQGGVAHIEPARRRHDVCLRSIEWNF